MANPTAPIALYLQINSSFAAIRARADHQLQDQDVATLVPKIKKLCQSGQAERLQLSALIGFWVKNLNQLDRQTSEHVSKLFSFALLHIPETEKAACNEAYAIGENRESMMPRALSM